MSSTSDTVSSAGSAHGVLAFIFGRGPLDRLAGLPAWIAGLVMLAPRIWLAVPFWNAGTQRFDRWEVQPYIFQDFGLPVFSADVWAYITVASEITLPILLVIGLLGRWAGLGLAAMAFTIYFLVGGAYAIESEQFPWMAVGLLVFILGPGRVSVDYAIRRFLLKD